MVRTVIGLDKSASYLTCLLPVASPHLAVWPSCGEEKLVLELEEATVRKNRGIFILQQPALSPVQSNYCSRCLKTDGAVAIFFCLHPVLWPEAGGG